jgi:hypothetical protein
MNPEATPCAACDCVDGEASYERWQFVGEPVFTDAMGNPSEVSRTCPRRLVSSDSYHMLDLYGHYKAGHLLIDGGIFDQPALYLESMRVIDSAIAKVRENAGKS